MKSQGITLVELLVAITIIGILALIGIPTFQKTKSNMQVKGLARTIASALHTAKIESFKGEPIAIDISSDKTSIKICEDEDRDGLCINSKYEIKIPEEINLDSNLEKIYFDKGLPTKVLGGFGAGSITIKHKKTEKCFKIILSKTGRIKITDC